MMISLVATIQSDLVMFFWPVIVVVGALIGYALYRKGDVRAEFGHGKTIFKLEAKDRRTK